MRIAVFAALAYTLTNAFKLVQQDDGAIPDSMLFAQEYQNDLFDASELAEIDSDNWFSGIKKTMASVGGKISNEMNALKNRKFVKLRKTKRDLGAVIREIIPEQQCNG